MLRAGVFAALLAGTAAGSEPFVETRPGDLVLTNTTVVPMDRDGVLARTAVVVRGDRIVAVVPDDRIAIGPGVTRIDGAGRWLLPGLADMHVHTWSVDDFTLFVAAGVTTVRNMFGAEPHLAWRDRIARGEMFGPTIVTASPIIDGNPPVWPGSIVLAEPADADRVVADLKAKGYDFLKPYSRLSREAYDALAAAGKKHEMPLEGHVPRAVGLARVLAAKQRTVEHLDGWLLALLPDGVPPPEGGEFGPRFPEVLPKIDESRVPRLVKETIAAGTWNCPTLIVLDRMAALGDPAGVRAKTKWLDKIAPGVLASWDPAKDFRLKTMTPERFAAMRKANAVRARILAALAKAGAPIVAGTDTGNPFVVPGEALHDELELMVASGMPRAQVLRAATANAADLLGRRGDFGVVAPGARADLILVPTNPLEGPLPLVPDGVLLRGRWLAKPELEARLREVAKSVSSPPASRWDRVPALPVAGRPVHEAHYDMTSGGKSVGEERLAVVPGESGRSIVAQVVAELPDRVEIAYTLGPGASSIAVTSTFGSIALSGTVAAGLFQASGTDGRGRSVNLSKPIPADAFLSGPGMGGSIHLAAKLASMAVGEKRSLTSLELGYFPSPEITSVAYEVARKPDAGRHRVYAVTSVTGGTSVSGDLVVDADGFPVSQVFGPPLDLTIARRPAAESPPSPSQRP